MRGFDLIDTARQEFERNGVVCLPGLFDRSWLDTLSVGLEKNFADPDPGNTVCPEEGRPGGFYDDYCNWPRIDEYRAFIIHSPAAEIAARIMRSKTARIYHEHVIVKEPGTDHI